MFVGIKCQLGEFRLIKLPNTGIRLIRCTANGASIFSIWETERQDCTLCSLFRSREYSCVDLCREVRYLINNYNPWVFISSPFITDHKYMYFSLFIKSYLSKIENFRNKQ